MADPIRIANCSGFYGDRLSAAQEMVDGGPIDVLTGDWLAELTMLILARTRAKRPGGGHAATFVRQMEQVMGTCLEQGIRVVSNAGGLDPEGCAEAIAEVADRLGLSPCIAYVGGDDLLPRIDELSAAGINLFDPIANGSPARPENLVSANAYLGCWGIVEALNRGANIVVTGRTTDAAIVCGPAAWHHQWARDDWDSLAGAVVAGHVIECGTQATGGNYSFFTEVSGMARVGFPWAEVAADGSAVVGKHEGTGGEVSVGTVTSQLLYEIGSPAYLGPDVTARFDTVKLDQIEPDRVHIHGTKGEPPPRTLKVSMNEMGGHRCDLSIALTGLDIDAKAALAEEAFWTACPHVPEDFESVVSRVIRTDKSDPDSNEEAVAQWCLTLKDSDERKVGRGVFNAMTEMALATIPGFFSLRSGGSRPFGIHRAGLVPADLVPQHVVVLDGPSGPSRTVVDSVAPDGYAAAEGLPGPEATAPDGPTVPGPLGLVVGARSGDKGGDANLGVFVREDSAWAWLDNHLTVERLRVLLPEAAELEIERYRLPAVRSLNFVIHGLLGEGVAASTRLDGQAKSLGEWLRARVVDLPIALLPNEAPTWEGEQAR
ncbi:MAG: exopolyphosphatase [Acidimicrobiaceae bacterium]|nr:exopolyphosphatase [Acidimicrobiaceae bacterium]|tara:strand:- start:1577 stop:3379 length:1803 start_codon:yes stop_codon:yes gene_type:complete